MAYRMRYFAAGRAIDDVLEVIPLDPPSTAAAEARQRRHMRRRAQTHGKPFRFDAIAERDGWRCHLCGRRIDPTISRRHPMGATIDHLVPIAAGGGDEPENVALAHRDCNIRRGTKGIAQLRLVG